MHLIVVRHGQPENQGSDGDGDPPLTDLGREQAAAVGRYLALEKVDHIVASPMLRAHGTAMPLAEMLGYDVELDDDLKEAGWNGGPYRRSEENIRDFVDKIEADPDHFYRPEGRSAFAERVHRSFRRIAAENGGRNVAVFCHGMVTATLVASIMGSGDPMEDGLNPSYTSITRVQSSSDSTRRRLVSFNEHQHLRSL